MKKVMFVLTPAFDPTGGGVQNTTFKLGREFTLRGYEISYYSYTVDGHIQVDYGQLYHALEKGGSANEKNNLKLTALIAELKPHLVINQMPYEVGIQHALNAAKLRHQFVALGCLRNSLFSVVNNLETYAQKSLPKALHFFSRNALFQKFILARHKRRHANSLRGILSNHDYFVLLVPTNIDELRYFLTDFDENKILAIPNSIPDIHEDLTNKEKVILHVGRLNFSQKRSDLIVPFWEKLHKRLPDWTFEIVGYGEMENHVKNELMRLNLPRVKFFGKQNPIEYYKRASLFMMPSAYEGFPNTLLEAQSHGCVPFCFDSYPAVRWIVNDIEDGFLIKPFDLDDMVQQMVVVAKNDGLLQQHANFALNNAKRFVVDRVVDLWEEKFNEICMKS
jgi:glycosyltransferase involved in cell wall biosynthesis